MPYEFIPMFWFLFLLLGCWGLILIGRSIREKSRLREREMIHRERIEAMQKGLPVPELGSSASSTPIETALAGSMSPHFDSATALHWFRTVSLALGLLFLFAGMGMCVAFLLGSDLRDVWSIGLIPAMAGIGLLIFYRLSADLTSATE